MTVDAAAANVGTIAGAAPGAGRRTAPVATPLTDRVAATGLVGSVAILVASLVAAIPYRDLAGMPYSPLNHFVSELGERGVSTMAPLFDAALVVGGGCLVVFFAGLARGLPGLLPLGAAVAGAIAGIGGIGAGLYPMNERAAHIVASMTFFLAAWVAVALLSAHIAVDRGRALPRRLVPFGAATAVTFVAFVAVYAVAAGGAQPAEIAADRPAVWAVPLLEWASLLALMAWVAAVAVALLRRPDAT